MYQLICIITSGTLHEEGGRRNEGRQKGVYQADASEDPIHAVLGGPEPDVDTVAATLCLALHLSQ
ncbi:protein prune homolog 2 isoform X5, partial [Lates japonicus]